MASGVVVNPSCQTTFLKMAEGKKEFRYIFFKIVDKEIAVEKSVRPEEIGTGHDDYEDNSRAAFEAFVTDLKETTENFRDCRYAVFDFKFKTHREGAGESKCDKIVFFQVCPDGASIKKKMVYASSASAIKSALGTGKITPLQVSDESELSHKDLLIKMSDKYSA